MHFLFFCETVHCGSIRQTASILSMSKECLRTGDKALIHFRFIKHPEYMVAGQRMVFREGRTKAVGNVVRIFTQSTNAVLGSKVKPTKQQRLATGNQHSPKISVPKHDLKEVKIYIFLYNYLLKTCI